MTTTEGKPEGYIKHETYNEALCAFQAELPSVTKGKTGDAGSYKYKYADLADVVLAGHPVLSKHGFSFSSKPTLNDEGKFVLAYVLRHDSGGQDGGEFPLPSSGNMQAMGGAISYARRYSFCAVTDIVAEEDTDARGAGEVRTESPRRGRTQQRSQPSQPRQNGNSGGAPSEAQQAREALRTAAEKNGWDLQRVADVFATQHGVSLRDTDRAEDVRAFLAALAADAEHVLGQSAPEGATT